MTDPITPPPELVQRWLSEFYGDGVSTAPGEMALDLATRAAQWGADQELEACCEWVAEESPFVATELCAARRPKPLGLAKKAWMVLAPYGESGRQLTAKECDTIRRALERLQELEGGNG